MKRFKLQFYLLIFFTAVNCYIYLNRNDYVFEKQSSYLDLYTKKMKPSVNRLEKANDSTLVIKLNAPPRQPLNWFVKADGKETVKLYQTEPSVTLKQGVYTYTIFSDSLPDTLSIKAEYFPNNYFNNAGNKQQGGIVIYKSTPPYPDGIENDEKWNKNKISISREDEAVLQVILKDSIQIKQGDSTIEKIKKLGRYLGGRIGRSRGLPTDSIVALPVFQQYKAALAGDHIWCGIYAQIFDLFANAAQIKSRYIEIKRSYGSVSSGVHVFNEYFIPEQKAWAAIDIMFNNLAYIDGAGKYLNGVEVKNTDPANSSVSVLQGSVTDTLAALPFNQMEPAFFDFYAHDKNLYFYYASDSSQVYSFKEKLKRYFIEESWYEVYSDNNLINNRPFYIKQLFIFIEILLLLILFLSMVIELIYKKIAPSVFKTN